LGRAVDARNDRCVGIEIAQPRHEGEVDGRHVDREYDERMVSPAARGERITTGHQRRQRARSHRRLAYRSDGSARVPRPDLDDGITCGGEHARRAVDQTLAPDPQLGFR
jgi:hypothetical protein